MRRRGILIGAGVVLGLVLLALWSARGTPKAGVAVIGDKAQTLLQEAKMSQTLPLHTAAVTVVSVTDWLRLSYVADMHALCGHACDGDVGIVRILRLSPTGSDKVVILNHENLGLIDNLPCLAAVLRAETAQIGAPENSPSCAADPVAQTHWHFPGLGTF